MIIGALALALAGIFLVKLAVDRNYFNPAVRVIAGAVAGLALLGIAQWRRRAETLLAQGLSASGIVALFAAAFAATTLYHFVPSPIGFSLLACITALAVGLSLQNPGGGPLIATLGLFGGFVTPILVNTESPNVPALFGYLLVLHVGLMAVTRMRAWSVLAAITMVFSSAWLILWIMFEPWNPADAALLGAFMLASSGSMILVSLSESDQPHASVRPAGLTWLGAVMGLLMACLLVGRSGYSNLEWAYFAVLLAGCFFLARSRRRYEPLAWLGSAAVLAMLCAWGVSINPSVGWTGNAPSAVQLAHLRWLFSLFGAGTVVAAYGCMWKSVAPRNWAMLCVVSAGAYVAAMFGFGDLPPRPHAWAEVPLSVAVMLFAMAIPVYHRRGQLTGGERVLSVFSHGVLFQLAIAAPMAFEHDARTAAWAALLPLAAWTAWRMRIGGLINGFGALLALLCFRGLLFFGRLGEPMEGTLFWNPVVWTFGSGLAALLLSLWPIEKLSAKSSSDGNDAAAARNYGIPALVQISAAAGAFLLISLLVRWHFQAGQLDHLSAPLLERGSYAWAWLLLAAGMLWVGKSTGRRMLIGCGEILAAAGMAYLLVILVLIANPLWLDESVGGWIVFNDLFFVYAIPMALCWLMGQMLAGTNGAGSQLSRAATVLGFILLVVVSGLEIRQGFEGEFLDRQATGFVELGTYPIVWLVLAGGLLWAGHRMKRQVLERAGFWIAGLAIAMSVLICGGLANPLIVHQSVGAGRIVNWLLYVFGVPAAGAGILVGTLQNRGTADRKLAVGAAIASLFLTFLLVTLEVRQFFQGEFLDAPNRTHAEMISYSFAWAILGALFLAAGIIRHSPLLRWASLMLMFATIIKVFIFDMADLRDLLRVLSFAGLGLSLMALAFVYQHFVFRKPATAAVPPPAI